MEEHFGPVNAGGIRGMPRGLLVTRKEGPAACDSCRGPLGAVRAPN
jgi:hypothetical protein